MAERFFQEEKFWRYLTTFWTAITFVYLVIDFCYQNTMDYLMGPILALYIGLLSIYAGTKEFDRWHDYHDGKHPGEWYVLLWTALLVVLIGLNVFANHAYRLPSEVVAAYIGVLGIFALTQKSKELFRHKTCLK